MRKSTLLLLATLAAVPALADDDEKKAPAQPVENLYFSTDEYIAIPKFNFSYGYRALKGSKASFSGDATVRNTSLNTYQTNSDATSAPRYYNDGTVYPNVSTDGNGHATPSDGTTNSWFYSFENQVVTVDGVGKGILFHSYSAKVVDEGWMKQNMGNSYGMEATMSYDLPKLGRYVQWCLTGGISLNDIRQGLDRAMRAEVTVIEDFQYLNGATPPPISTTTGNPSISTKPDRSTPILPLTADGLPRTVDGVLNSRYRLKGSYYTLRVGPTFIVPFSAKFHLTFGCGTAMVIAGTTYTIDNEYLPDEKNALIRKNDGSYDTFVRPGYYLDANVEYWISERSGLYAGAIFQSSGSYEQKVVNNTTGAEADYSTRVDLSAQSGLRMGMNIRF